MPIQTAADSISNSQGSPFGFKNRIINGAMVFDQRNAGASVSATNAELYTVDRFKCLQGIATSKFTVQQSSTVPTGFTKSVVITSSSAYTVLSSDYFLYRQTIEGFNVADLGWGTANAQTVTLSFWVRSSLTGTFGGALGNGASNRSYPFSYTINAANTFEYKTVTIAGDTSGTWETTTNAGIVVGWSIGMGSTYEGTANAWAGTFYGAPTGSVDLVATNGATLYITGVQLEKGSQATAFDYRDYGNELRLCQRYAWKYGGAGNDQYLVPTGLYFDGNTIYCGPIQHPVTMRASVSMTTYGSPIMKNNGGAITGFTAAVGVPSNQQVWVEMTKASHGITNSLVLNLNTASTSDYFIFSAEL